MSIQEQEEFFVEEVYPEPSMINFRLAGFWIRLIAYLMDWLIVSALSYLVVKPLAGLLGIEQLPLLFYSSILTIGLMGFIYFTLLTKLWSQTLGKMIVGIKVIRQDGQPLDWGTCFFREIVGRTLSQSLGLHLGYIWIAFHPRKKSWHDLISDTYVVYEQEVEERRLISIPYH